MTTIHRTAAGRKVYVHDPDAPRASVVVPSVFVVVRRGDGRLLLVRRCDSGAWELPGGRVDVGENACEAAVRETAEEAGVPVVITGFAGMFTDPGYVVQAPDGEVRQVFALVLRARALDGTPHGDAYETSEAAWFAPGDLGGLVIASPARAWIEQALDVGARPYLG